MNPLAKRSPADLVALVFFAAFGLLALAAGYWTMVAREALVTRTDNPRALIAFNRIRRGTILDRNGLPLAESTGDPGNYLRRYEPSSALTVGYASFTYDLSGVEAAADSILTGSEGLDPLMRWWQFDTLGQPQIGRDVTLTLDLNWQRRAFTALNGYLGAFVIIDTETGEVLALASSPSFDPALLDENFETLNEDLDGPLVNRATLGLYSARDLLEHFPSTLDLSQTPSLPIPVLPAEGNRLTPVQMAYLVAAIPSGGTMPPQSLVFGLPVSSHPTSLFSPSIAGNLQPLLRNGLSATISSGFEDETLGWYVVLAQNDKLAVAIVLENATAKEAEAVWRAAQP